MERQSKSSGRDPKRRTSPAATRSDSHHSGLSRLSTGSFCGNSSQLGQMPEIDLSPIEEIPSTRRHDRHENSQGFRSREGGTPLHFAGSQPRSSSHRPLARQPVNQDSHRQTGSAVSQSASGSTVLHSGFVGDRSENRMGMGDFGVSPIFSQSERSTTFHMQSAPEDFQNNRSRSRLSESLNIGSSSQRTAPRQNVTSDNQRHTNSSGIASQPLSRNSIPQSRLDDERVEHRMQSGYIRSSPIGVRSATDGNKDLLSRTTSIYSEKERLRKIQVKRSDAEKMKNPAESSSSGPRQHEMCGSNGLGKVSSKSSYSTDDRDDKTNIHHRAQTPQRLSSLPSNVPPHPSSSFESEDSTQLASSRVPLVSPVTENGPRPGEYSWDDSEILENLPPIRRTDSEPNAEGNRIDLLGRHQDYSPVRFYPKKSDRSTPPTAGENALLAKLRGKDNNLEFLDDSPRARPIASQSDQGSSTSRKTLSTKFDDGHTPFLVTEPRSALTSITERSVVSDPMGYNYFATRRRSSSHMPPARQPVNQESHGQTRTAVSQSSSGSTVRHSGFDDDRGEQRMEMGDLGVSPILSQSQRSTTFQMQSTPEDNTMRELRSPPSESLGTSPRPQPAADMHSTRRTTPSQDHLSHSTENRHPTSATGSGRSQLRTALSPQQSSVSRHRHEFEEEGSRRYDYPVGFGYSRGRFRGDSAIENLSSISHGTDPNETRAPQSRQSGTNGREMRSVHPRSTSTATMPSKSLSSTQPSSHSNIQNEEFGEKIRSTSSQRTDQTQSSSKTHFSPSPRQEMGGIRRSGRVSSSDAPSVHTRDVTNARQAHKTSESVSSSIQSNKSSSSNSGLSINESALPFNVPSHPSSAFDSEDATQLNTSRSSDRRHGLPHVGRSRVPLVSPIRENGAEPRDTSIIEQSEENSRYRRSNPTPTRSGSRTTFKDTEKDQFGSRPSNLQSVFNDGSKPSTSASYHHRDDSFRSDNETAFIGSWEGRHTPFIYSLESQSEDGIDESSEIQTSKTARSHRKHEQSDFARIWDEVLNSKKQTAPSPSPRPTANLQKVNEKGVQKQEKVYGFSTNQLLSMEAIPMFQTDIILEKFIENCILRRPFGGGPGIANSYTDLMNNHWYKFIELRLSPANLHSIIKDCLAFVTKRENHWRSINQLHKTPVLWIGRHYQKWRQYIEDKEMNVISDAHFLMQFVSEKEKLNKNESKVLRSIYFKN